MSLQALSGSDLKLIYERRFAGREDYRLAVWGVLCREVFSKWIFPDSSVLDLGSGYCEFINQITAGRR
jgi:dolichol-phosphate mannosyltransferase